ncbi:heparan-alpha-glucosaminide N-acetyltransferase domain-containing protein [Maribacter sp. PR1]|uniref:Heparan-alpha-glucosaminide N-acetyltransferase domain-containing protein n=1 Tax=Maribacter cobaltidurans TaxID=1178778 RepID=A0ABU7IWS3_9FLAO|nr:MULTISPECIES: heparan-alpha-glucosaminide N-acetyltransferase domain-containing protein [Maribacter]MDC6389654.1 heparan-alpha-glucosaminide N-acetyltransferase domain-containing protein [Maribacter sp. PR1]MEE1977043.1 heparan-alpha-glucosaminide N-acetyltransferase domain-containing protein [Maribacter cobaltidurans]
MNKNTTRLFFIDAIRAWAILMMLQGHFIDGLLDPIYRDNSNMVYSVWKYFRGITAPVFFTVSGFIFTYLLIKVPQTGLNNPRVQKGIKRGVQLIFIGYLLRLNLWGLFKGEIYSSFYFVDVLHCIGLSILSIIVIYLITSKSKKWLFPTLMLLATLVLFIFEPYYKTLDYSFLPQWLANYFTKSSGSVFTIIPWLGYTAFGSFVSILFSKNKEYKYLYTISIPLFAIIGLILIYFSSDFFLTLSRVTGVKLFSDIFFNNYLFIRLGDVLVVFSVFMLFRQFLTNRTGLRLGQSTLSIYVIHFIILYGSFTGLGLYAFFHHTLNPWISVTGAIAFMIVCSFLALKYEDRKTEIKAGANQLLNLLKLQLERFLIIGFSHVRTLSYQLFQLLGLIKN